MLSKQKNNMIAFFCATPYQILIAIQIKIEFYHNQDADIYILNHFENSAKIARNLETKNIFKTVKVVISSLEFTRSISQKSRKRHILKLFSYYNYKKYAYQYFTIKNQVYDDVFFSYADVIIQLGLKKILYNNRKCKIHLFEDGVGGYLNFGTKRNVKKKFFNLFTFSYGLENYVDLYAFAPNLMYKTLLPVVKIPSIDSCNLQFKKKINDIFGFKSERITSKFVLLEQPLTFAPNINEIQVSIFKEVLIYDHILKLHPRSDSNHYNNFNLFIGSEIPWEIIILNSIKDDEVLISFYSTAAITNKLIFDREGPIIFLYKIDKFEKYFKVSAQLDDFFKKFQENLKQPKNVFFPKNIEEFKQILVNLNS